MAAAVVPLIDAGVQILAPFVPKIVVALEQWFGAKTGDTKKSVGVSMLTTAANALSTAGKIPNSLDATTISTMIEQVVADLKSQGLLTGASTPSSVATAAATSAAPAIQASSTMRAVLLESAKSLIDAAK